VFGSQVNRRQAMAKAKSGEPKAGELSAEKAAKILGVDEKRVEILAGQGRLIQVGTPQDPRYDLDSVLSMQAEHLIREMLEEAGDMRPELREKIDTLALLQYQRGREAAQRADLWEVVERIEKVGADVGCQMAELREMNEESKKRREEAERRLEEVRRPRSA
jgi:hypothetical protein